MLASSLISHHYLNGESTDARYIPLWHLVRAFPEHCPKAYSLCVEALDRIASRSPNGKLRRVAFLEWVYSTKPDLLVLKRWGMPPTAPTVIFRAVAVQRLDLGDRMVFHQPKPNTVSLELKTWLVGLGMPATIAFLYP